MAQTRNRRAGVEDRVAREAVGEERDKLFEAMATTYSNFAAYQARATERNIGRSTIRPSSTSSPRPIAAGTSVSSERPSTAGYVDVPRQVDVGERRHRCGHRGRAEHRERRRSHRRVDQQRQAQRHGDRQRDRALRIPDLFAERRDPRIPGEGEEQQPRSLQHPVHGRI